MNTVQPPVSEEFDRLAYQAKLAGQAGDWHGARNAWAKALELTPPASDEYRTIKARIDKLDEQLQSPTSAVWAKRAAKLSPLLVLWGKAKFLLLGLTKIKTLFSMLAFLGVYWSLYGWKFALGFVISIYIHEMGHVAELRKYGVAASAPMFIPGFGAFIMLKQRLANVGQDARVGLAGPVWGLGAAIAAWVVAVVTGQPVWYAIAHTGAFINLFNLIPVWQFDGGRGFRALTRGQRGMALVVILAMFAVTTNIMLLLLAAGAAYRLFNKDYAAEPDNFALVEYSGLIVLLSMLVLYTS
jgi:Zn-dependent protease